MWHADALHTLAAFTGLIAISSQGVTMQIKRAAYEVEKKDLCRYLDIIFRQVRRSFAGVFFMKLLDSLVKLELQVAVMAVGAFFLRDHGHGGKGALRFLLMDYQRIVMVSISIITTCLAVVQEIMRLAAFCQATEKARESKDDEVKKQLERTDKYMVYYVLLLAAMAAFIAYIAQRLFFVLKVVVTDLSEDAASGQAS
eukprot:UN0648